jgi:dipeptidyl aminopeptidase/acylaminoacyl peptidase
LRAGRRNKTSFDGLEISAYLFKPKEAEEGQRLPAVIWVHGGPDWQYSNFWYPIVAGFANQDFVVLCPNYRGGTGYGKEFEVINDKDWGGSDLKDIVASAQYLIKNGFVLPQKIAISGKSYGGFMTYTALTKAPELWAAWIAFMGPSNLMTI